MDFKIQYIGQDGTLSNYISYIYNVPIVGSNTYISGQDNLLFGSISIGQVTSSGIQMSGNNGSYVKSVGYDG